MCQTSPCIWRQIWPCVARSAVHKLLKLLLHRLRLVQRRPDWSQKSRAQISYQGTRRKDSNLPSSREKISSTALLVVRTSRFLAIFRESCQEAEPEPRQSYRVAQPTGRKPGASALLLCQLVPAFEYFYFAKARSVCEVCRASRYLRNDQKLESPVQHSATSQVGARLGEAGCRRKRQGDSNCAPRDHAVCALCRGRPLRRPIFPRRRHAVLL